MKNHRQAMKVRKGMIRDIYKYIETYDDVTISDIMEDLGFSNKSISNYFKILEKEGFIHIEKRGPNKMLVANLGPKEEELTITRPKVTKL
jgi:Mn-dependent DtxR family transcriptional regulator